MASRATATLLKVVFGLILLDVAWQVFRPELIVAVIVGLLAYAGVFGLWSVKRRKAHRAAGDSVPSNRDLLRVFLTERKRRRQIERQWRLVCETTAMKGGLFGSKVHPRLLSLDPNLSGDFTARVTSKLTGVTFDKIQSNHAAIKQTVGCHNLEIAPGANPSMTVLRFYFSNALERILPVSKLPESPRGYLSYGTRPDGSQAAIVATQSVLLGGMTRHGKSNTVWALLADAVRKGLYIDLYVSDPKEGIELYLLGKALGLATGRVRVVEYVTGEGGSKETMEMVQRVVARMKVRGAAHAGSGNEMGISKDNPLIVVLLDELLEVAKELKAGGQDSAPGTILYKGSALSTVIWANTQIATKNVLGEARDMFPQSIAVATKSRAATDVILGDGASSEGADNHKLQGKKGRGNSASDDGPIRPFRAAHVRDGWDQFHEHYDAPKDDRLRISQGLMPRGMKRAGQEAKETRCAVYRLYGRVGERLGMPDEQMGEGRELVYIGKGQPKDRIGSHRRSKAWFPDVDEAATVIQWYPSEEKALQVEEAAIKDEMPRENDQHNRANPLRRHRLRVVA